MCIQCVLEFKELVQIFVQSYQIAYILYSCILVRNYSSFLFILLFPFLPLLPFLVFSRDLKVIYMKVWNKAAGSRIMKKIWKDHEDSFSYLQYVNGLVTWNSVVYIPPNTAKFHSFHIFRCILWYYNGCSLPLCCSIMKTTATRVHSEVQLPFYLSYISSATPDLVRPHSEVQHGLSKLVFWDIPWRQSQRLTEHINAKLEIQSKTVFWLEYLF